MAFFGGQSKEAADEQDRKIKEFGQRLHQKGPAGTTRLQSQESLAANRRELGRITKPGLKSVFSQGQEAALAKQDRATTLGTKFKKKKERKLTRDVYGHVTGRE